MADEIGRAKIIVEADVSSVDASLESMSDKAQAAGNEVQDSVEKAAAATKKAAGTMSDAVDFVTNGRTLQKMWTSMPLPLFEQKRKQVARASLRKKSCQALLSRQKEPPKV